MGGQQVRAEVNHGCYLGFDKARWRGVAVLANSL